MSHDQEPIFAVIAPKYYARGIPVIPLQYHEKKPIPQGWSKFHDTMPTQEEQDQWIKFYPASNVGVVLGEKSGLCVIDIDYVNEEQLAVINAVLEAAHGGRLSPWKRVGAKGMVLAYKFSGVKTFRIKDINQNTLVEMLSSRTQVVLPPSIHPTTQRPYTATGELLDMIDDLPVLNTQIEDLLRHALKEAGYDLSLKGWTRTTDWTPAGARDVKMTSMAGIYAHGVLRGERSLLEAISFLKTWAEEFTEKVAGDPVDIKKGVQNLIAFLIRDVVEKKKVLPKGWDDGLTEEDKAKMGLSFGNDDVEWGFEDIKDHLHGQFEIHEQGSAGRMAAINNALSKIAKATNLNTLDVDRLLKFISDASGKEFSITSLRTRIKDLAKGEIQGTDHTEIAQAVIADIRQHTMLKFNGGKFWTWGGSHWIEKPARELANLIATNYGHLPSAKRHSDHNGIIAVIRNLVAGELVTDQINGVNFANGVLIRNGELKAHNPNYGMTYTLPFRYMPDLAGKAFKFQEFLERCWGEDPDYQEKLNTLQEVMCTTIFGIAPEYQRAILLHGAPKTGKSQLLTIAASLVPEEARASCPPDQWGDKFAPSTMYGKLINVCGELSERKFIDGQRFKSIVCGELMMGQYKGQDLFTFRPVCANWFASNHLPKTDDTSSAFIRRWVILHFSRPIRKDERTIINIGDLIVAEERESIAAWAVEALPRLRNKSDYSLPPSHEELIETVANNNNSVRFFIRESGRIEVTPVVGGKEVAARTSETKLFDAYWLHSTQLGGVKPVSRQLFGTQLRALVPEMDLKRIISSTANGSRETLYIGLTIVDATAE